MRVRLPHGGTVFVAAVFLFIAVLSFFVGLFERGGREKTGLSFSYHFLVRACETSTSAALAGEAYLAGGAGYLLESEGLVVLAGYYRKEDATYLQGTMSEKGVEVSVLTRSLGSFSAEHGMREKIEGNLTTLDSVSRLLFDAANGLERGGAQEEAHAAVRGAADALDGLIGKNSDGTFSLWNVELLRARRRAKEADAGLIFAKDLRYMQVALLFTILEAPAYFR